MAVCKHYKKMRTEGYCRCLRDGSIRKTKKCGRSACPKFRPKFWSLFFEWLFS